MKPIRTFIAIPALPAPIERLRELAHNLHWAWDHDTIELFRRLDTDLWETTGHNPVLMLGTIEQARLEAAATDEGFLAHLERVARDLDVYKASESTWFHRTYGVATSALIAYFSAEFGITECLSIFAGGLGVLAGDHLKSASDLGVPLVGVGLLYQQGYLQQYLNDAGRQQEAYKDNDFHSLPLTLERRADGTPLTVSIPHPGQSIIAQIWRAQVGRVPLYLLDTNIPANQRPDDRDITDQLYGGDREMRIRQEIVLGIGGFRALEALGLEPVVFHMNEGHSAFLALERTRRLMETHGLSFEEACNVASAGLVFTTHTPVPAGHDYFAPDLMDRYLGDYARALGLSRRDFLALGRQDPNNEAEPFCMTILALRMASHRNGVSRLHAQVSRRMWQGLWPRVPEDEVPIMHITNGVHFQSWLSREMKELYDRYLGPRWREDVTDQTVWQHADHIAAEELWRTHERRRERLVAFCRRRLSNQLVQRGASQAALRVADEILDPEALTIGFGRRFATYKRATLILRDPDRLLRILNHPDRPVQIVFAGKAHPRDDPGKELIQRVYDFAHQDAFRRRLVFIEDYDMAVARALVQGADVWLNTPLRPREASGTSGMKAMANGVLNLSILDGWWDEAYTRGVGWAIGRRETYDNSDYQDQVEAEALYGLLERDIVPTFYDRGPDGLPRNWITLMKASIQTLCPRFTTHRMVGEYTQRQYLPVATHYQQMTVDNMARARALAAWKVRVQASWAKVRIEAADGEFPTEIPVGGVAHVQAQVQLGDLKPDDVAVQVYLGRIDAAGEIIEADAIPMEPIRSDGNGSYLYQTQDVSCRRSGMYGYTVRVIPKHPDLIMPFLPGLIVWA